MKLRSIIPRRRAPIDRERLLARLPAVEYRPAAGDDELSAQSSLPQSALLMAEVDQEREHRLCRETAERLVGTLPDPGDIPV